MNTDLNDIDDLIGRSPLGGRNFESYAEDPLLAGRIGAAFVRGVQSEGVIATVKHLAGNESETDRFVADSVIDERTLREVHLRPFELAVREGGALAVMTSYNRLNGSYCADDRHLLHDVLREDWGFEGFVMSDWFALVDTERAIVAGLDLEMPGPGRAFGPALAAAVRDGRVLEADVDAAVTRLLTVLDRVGALDDLPTEPAVDSRPEHVAVARAAAAASMVLLQNDGTLPLDASQVRRLAVIGPNADRAAIMGGGSASLSVADLRSPVAELRDRLGSHVEIVHEPGVDISLTAAPIPAEWLTAPDGSPGMVAELRAVDDLEGPMIATVHVADGTATWLGQPAPDTPRTFSARLLTTLRVETPGRWTLSLVQTVPARLLVDGEVVLDGTTEALVPGDEMMGLAAREITVDLDLDPERPVELMVEFQHREAALVTGCKLGLRAATPADGIERAAAAAATADAVVVVVGTDGQWEREGHDRGSMALPGRQDELVRRVLAVAPHAVVVLNTGAPVALPWLADAGVLLQSWFGGQEMAAALVDVLFGDSEPGGRLPTTFPVRIEDGPAWGNFPAEEGTIRYGERILIGHRWYESRGLPVNYAFGHGLSYTTFQIGAPTLSSPHLGAGETLSIDVPVTNTGDRRGSEVVQLYVGADDSPVLRAPKQLAAFTKVTLEPGESIVTSLSVDRRAFARWVAVDDGLDAVVSRLAGQAGWVRAPQRPAHTGWVVDEGGYTLHIGRSSRSISHAVEVGVSGGPA